MLSFPSARPYLSLCLLSCLLHCGSIKNAAQTVGEKATDAKDSTVSKAEDVKDGAQDKAEHLGQQVDDWVNKEPLRQRREACDKENGQWVELLEVSACEDGVVSLVIDGEQQTQSCVDGEGDTFEKQCLHRADDGQAYFNDGPSVPNLLQRVSGSLADRSNMLHYNELFWAAGVNHDYCYHHGNAAYNFTQEDCDRQYLTDLSAVCSLDSHYNNHWFRKKNCRAFAGMHYVAVRTQGNPAYRALNSLVKYPEWVPLWVTYGMDEDPTDDTLVDEVKDKADFLGMLPEKD